MATRNRTHSIQVARGASASPQASWRGLPRDDRGRRRAVNSASRNRRVDRKPPRATAVSSRRRDQRPESAATVPATRPPRSEDPSGVLTSLPMSSRGPARRSDRLGRTSDQLHSERSRQQWMKTAEPRCGQLSRRNVAIGGGVNRLSRPDLLGPSITLLVPSGPLSRIRQTLRRFRIRASQLRITRSQHHRIEDRRMLPRSVLDIERPDPIRPIRRRPSPHAERRLTEFTRSR